MRIERFAIRNYKSFLDSDAVELSPGFNVVVGRNNAGKTALAEALSLHFGSHPHRSHNTAATRSSPVPGWSRAEVTFAIGGAEFRELIGLLRPTVWLPYAAAAGGLAEAALESFFSAYRSNDEKFLTTVIRAEHLERAELLGLGPSTSQSESQMSVQVDIDDYGRVLDNMTMRTVGQNGQEMLPYRLAGLLRERVYSFRAERLNLSQVKFGTSADLAPDARNLPEVLNTLQGFHPRMADLNALVNLIFPDVRQVSVEPYGDGFRILVWPVHPGPPLPHLAVSLGESGTGIGQVLAMLYVAMTSEYPRTIVIDEPQSFLHPGAVRKLFDLLRLAAQHEHQYVVTTHSPTAVTAADPRRLLLVRKAGMESVVESIDVAQTEATRRMLAEVGARLADVFGADDVLWVEGMTEERCFPLIVRKFLKRPLLGTTILGVTETGTLEGRQARTTWEIYRKLSRGPNLIPAAVGLVFDCENRSEKERVELEKETGRAVRFLPRRMYENYLLNPSAITAVIARIDGFIDEGADPITVDQVEDWLNLKGGDRKYLPPRVKAEPLSEDWLREVHGAKLLKDLFSDLSKTRVQYLKVEYGEELTRWILDNASEDLREVGDLLGSILPPVEIGAGSALAVMRSG